MASLAQLGHGLINGNRCVKDGQLRIPVFVALRSGAAFAVLCKVRQVPTGS